MSGSERRSQIIHIIENTSRPVPAKDLASNFGVSRQVIVQDVALIRASGYDILSTNRGYILLQKNAASRVFKVSHTDEQLESELCAIVDLGATVVNVMVNHHVYGHIEAPLNISSRKDVRDFVRKLRESKSGPLKNTTSNFHYHTVEANDESTLDEVEHALRDLGFLIEQNQ